MADPGKEPLCTVKELLVFGVICVVYSSILFSLDPEWVGWAAPLVFGGAFYAADPPPASAHLSSPRHVFPAACCMLRPKPLRHSPLHLGPGQAAPQLAAVVQD